MTVVNSLDEARDWFLAHASGLITCVRPDGVRKPCASYPEADKFYAQSEFESDMERKGLSSDCTLEPMLVLAIIMSGREHPCDRCNMDRKVCRGYPRKDSGLKQEVGR